MARTLLTVRDLTRTGGYMSVWAETVLAANGGMYRNSNREFLRIGNTTGAPITVSVPIPGTVDGASVASKSWVINNNEYLYLPPFPSDYYNYQNEMVYLNTTDTISVVIFRDGT
jgi:hypothetical protein